MDRLRDRIEQLDELDRAVVVLRAIEQNPNRDVAALLGLTPNAVSLRYNRVRKRLAEELPDSVFGELPDDVESDEVAL